MNPLLSIGIIFKNEARCLERCLTALQFLKEAVPCEIIMADTGSEDGSREIAERYADQVFDFPWIDDFAAARNAVMDRCSGQWYLSVDADEVLDRNFGELLAFLHSPAAEQAQFCVLTIHNYTDPQDLTKFVPFQAMRLAKLSTGVRYIGKIHEKFAMEKGAPVCGLPHTILWHDGYLKQGGKKKDRNLPMIQKELEQDPENPVLLMQALESSSAKEQAAEYAVRIMDLIHSGKNSRPGLEPIMYRDAVKIACVYELPQYREWIQEAVERFPDSPYVRLDICYYGASMALRTNDWQVMGEYSRIYLEEAERYHREGGTLTMGALWSVTRDFAETVSLIRANYLAHVEDWDGCRAILEAHPLKEVEMQNLMLWFSLVFNHLAHMDLIDVFRQTGRDFFGGDAKLNQRDQEKLKIFMNACGQMFVKGYEDTPFYLVEALGDCEMAHWAAIMTAEDPEKMKAETEKIRFPQSVPPVVRKKLEEHQIELAGI